MKRHKRDSDRDLEEWRNQEKSALEDLIKSREEERKARELRENRDFIDFKKVFFLFFLKPIKQDACFIQ